MCGIVGIVNYDKSNNITKDFIAPLTDVISHRGPDGYGYWLDNNIGLGHRRLSIIDLEGSKQPMSVDENQYTISYNGEIYNYLELKKELQNLGHHFTTTGDTEALLKAYQQWGTSCLDRLRGMFAFIIVDKQKNEIFIARDHFGIKPLIYYIGESFFMAASEIQQFKKHPKFQKAINYDALSDYLKVGYIPAPHTIYKNLHKLECGNFLRLNFEGKIIEHKQYYDVEFKPNTKVSYNEWVERVEEALDTSVNYHKRADVAYGSFLSGGIDSSLIVSSLANGGEDVNAFTMGFKNSAVDEVPYAKQVAEKCNLKHHIDYVDMSSMESVFPKLQQHYGEPFADSSAIPSYFISKKIREHLPVVLSGDGGDEAFGGYYSYQNFLKIANPSIPKHAYKDTLKKILKQLGKTYPTTPRTPDLEDWIRLIGYISPAETQNIFTQNFQNEIENKVNPYQKWYQKAKEQKLDLYSLGSYLDYKIYMNSDILTKVDVASMMNSLEVRTPLIDVEMVNLMAQIPSKHKISRNADGTWNKKRILNSIAEKRFGKAFTQRKKQGFVIPLQDWFGKESKFGQEFFESIHNSNSKIFHFLEKQEVQSMFSDDENLNYNNLYLLYSLEKWLQSESI